MKIIFYCQHVLGIGHFFRSLEICRALDEHDVILVTGGPRPPEAELAGHIREVRLPGLMMTPDFSELLATDKNRSPESIKAERKQILLELLEMEKPDLFIVELYPFGRKAFKFELDPALEHVRRKNPRQCLSICSLRDILVEKKDQEKYEKRVVNILNGSFDALLVHSDPEIFSLGETFSKIHDIQIPLVYTGFVGSKPPDDACRIIRGKLNIATDAKLVVASAGGGKVGAPLLEATLEAAHLLKNDLDLHVEVFSGPFMNVADYRRLKILETKDFKVSRFTRDFPSYVKAADLSVSMGGYNTCMNILAAKTPAIVWPFPQNHEQRLRVERLAQKAPFTVLKDRDLTADQMALFILDRLLQKEGAADMVNLQGSINTAEWIKSLKKIDLPWS